MAVGEIKETHVLSQKYIYIKKKQPRYSRASLGLDVSRGHCEESAGHARRPSQSTSFCLGEQPQGITVLTQPIYQHPVTQSWLANPSPAPIAPSPPNQEKFSFLHIV